MGLFGQDLDAPGAHQVIVPERVIEWARGLRGPAVG